MNRVSPCLWFDHQAEDAARFYASVFEDTKVGRIARYTQSGAAVSGRPMGSVMTVDVELDGLHIECLNGGPEFKFTPAMSLFVGCGTEAEINQKWAKLSQGGTARMELDKYPWAERYGWTTDRFGVEWQLMLDPTARKIVPSFLFVDALFGKGEAAVNFYMSVFKNSKIDMIAREPATNTIMYSAFTLDDQGFTLMEGPGKHGYTFNEATSLIVHCETQAEVDYYWQAFSTGGGSEGPCGWLKDKFGVSWQIVPTVLIELMTDPKASDKVMAAMIKMKKLDIAALKGAAASS